MALGAYHSKPTTVTMKYQNVEYNDPKEISNAFAKHIVSVFETGELEGRALSSQHAWEEHSTISLHRISAEDVTYVLKIMKPKQSLELDGIHVTNLILDVSTFPRL